MAFTPATPVGSGFGGAGKPKESSTGGVQASSTGGSSGGSGGGSSRESALEANKRRVIEKQQAQEQATALAREAGFRGIRAELAAQEISRGRAPVPFTAEERTKTLALLQRERAEELSRAEATRAAQEQAQFEEQVHVVQASRGVTGKQAAGAVRQIQTREEMVDIAGERAIARERQRQMAETKVKEERVMSQARRPEPETELIPATKTPLPKEDITRSPLIAQQKGEVGSLFQSAERARAEGKDFKADVFATTAGGLFGVKRLTRNVISSPVKGGAMVLGAGALGAATAATSPAIAGGAIVVGSVAAGFSIGAGIARVVQAPTRSEAFAAGGETASEFAMFGSLFKVGRTAGLKSKGFDTRGPIAKTLEALRPETIKTQTRTFQDTQITRKTGRLRTGEDVDITTTSTTAGETFKSSGKIGKDITVETTGGPLVEVTTAKKGGKVIYKEVGFRDSGTRGIEETGTIKRIVEAGGERKTTIATTVEGQRVTEPEGIAGRRTTTKTEGLFKTEVSEVTPVESKADIVDVGFTKNPVQRGERILPEVRREFTETVSTREQLPIGKEGLIEFTDTTPVKSTVRTGKVVTTEKTELTIGIQGKEILSDVTLKSAGKRGELLLERPELKRLSTTIKTTPDTIIPRTSATVIQTPSTKLSTIQRIVKASRVQAPTRRSFIGFAQPQAIVPTYGTQEPATAQTPAQTQIQTPAQTPIQTPAQTPSITQTPAQTQIQTPAQTPSITQKPQPPIVPTVQVPGFPGFPAPPPPTPLTPQFPGFPAIPFIPSGSFLGRKGLRSPTREVRAVTPTATAAAFNIRGTTTWAGIKTGLGLRPLPKKKGEKKRGTKPKFNI